MQLEKGTILIISVLIMAVLLIMGAYFLIFTVAESKISKSQMMAMQTYYLAEAGINEAIWRINNDQEWENNFETPPNCYDWSTSSFRGDILLPGSSYNIEVSNSDCGKAEIISTSVLNLFGGKTSQRIVKTKVFKAIGSLIQDAAFFSGGNSENIDITASVLNINNGNIFSNNNANINLASNVSVFDDPDTEIEEGKAMVGNNLNISWGSSFNVSASCAKNICQGDCSEEGCPPSVVSMPMIDFDSIDENSYKSQASVLEEQGCQILCNGVQCSNKCVLSATEFSDLLWQVGQNGTLLLPNNITYITGSVDLKGGRILSIDGILVADGTINIGEQYCWTNKGKKQCGNNQISVSDPGLGVPSGILTKRKINFGLYSSSQDIGIRGLVYADDEIRLVSMPKSFTVIGGILARKLSITSAWSALNIYLNNNIILEGIWGGPKPPEGVKPPFSPVVTIEHWEEAY